MAHFAKQASNEAIECLKTKLASFLGFNFEFENGAAYHSVLFHYLKELQIKKINMQQAQSQLFLERLRYISNFKSPQPLKLLK